MDTSSGVEQRGGEQWVATPVTLSLAWLLLSHHCWGAISEEATRRHPEHTLHLLQAEVLLLTESETSSQRLLLSPSSPSASRGSGDGSDSQVTMGTPLPAGGWVVLGDPSSLGSILWFRKQTHLF